MSSQIKDQQQKVESKKDFDADHLLNQHIFKTLGYTGLGFGAGLATSLFFKHKAGMTLLFAGAGAGYGLSNMYSDINNLQRFKNYSQGEPQTLKREDQLSTKDWESFKPKEQNLDSQKQPQYGGSDDDSTDTKKSKPDQKVGSQTDLKNPPTTSKSSDKNKENDKSSQQSGEQKSSGSKVPSQGKESEKTPKQPEKGKESDKTVKQPEKTKESDKSAKQPEKTKESDKNVKQPENKETKLVSKPETKVEGQHFQDFTPKEAGKPKAGDDPFYKGAERPRKSGREQYSVSGDGPTRMTEQDRWGETKTQGGKTKTDPIPDTAAGSQFRGKSTAGSQTNAVIE